MFGNRLGSKQNTLVQVGYPTTGFASPIGSVSPSINVIAVPDSKVASPNWYSIASTNYGATGQYGSVESKNGSTFFLNSDGTGLRIWRSADFSASNQGFVACSALTGVSGYSWSGEKDITFFPKPVGSARIGAAIITNRSSNNTLHVIYVRLQTNWDDVTPTTGLSWNVIQNVGSGTPKASTSSNVFVFNGTDVGYIWRMGGPSDAGTDFYIEYLSRDTTTPIGNLVTINPIISAVGGCLRNIVTSPTTGMHFAFEPISSRVYSASNPYSWTMLASSSNYTAGSRVRQYEDHVTYLAGIFKDGVGSIQALRKNGTLGTTYTLPPATFPYGATDIVYFNGDWYLGAGSGAPSSARTVQWYKTSKDIFSTTSVAGDFTAVSFPSQPGAVDGGGGDSFTYGKTLIAVKG